MTITHHDLITALDDSGFDAGISIRADIEPLGGPGAPVKPAVYAGGLYQRDKRWISDGQGDAEQVDAVSIDNVPSQANRMEAALLRHRARLGLPTFDLDLAVAGDLPPHVMAKLSSLQFPHRHADAYLRDSLLDGEPFARSAIGKAVYASSATQPEALLQWFPGSLVFGFWQSHLGKKAPQTKFARAFDSEIVGLDPAWVTDAEGRPTFTKRLGLKGDPNNLSVDTAIEFDPDDQMGVEWQFTGAGKAGRSKAKDSLAEVGHGQVPVSGSDAPLAAVSFRRIEQLATLSFARLRTISTTGREADAAARSLLAALGLVAYTTAFSGGYTLRSGCDLRTVRSTWIWRGEDGDRPIDPLSTTDAFKLFSDAVGAAEAAGLPVGTRWASEPVALTPKPNLVVALQKTFGLA